MIYLQYLLQIVAGLGIFNVWLLRFGQDTVYRGGNASNMREEFVVYGLPTVALYIVGFVEDSVCDRTHCWNFSAIINCPLGDLACSFDDRCTCDAL